MTNYRSRIAALLFALAIAVFGGAGVAANAAPAPGPASSTQADCGDTSGFKHQPLSELPKEATDTYQLIQKGGPYPYPGKDGSVFTNREGVLPNCAASYYHEYTVPTPGSPDRGARRLITGEGGEYFYTGDHYRTFSLIDVNK